MRKSPTSCFYKQLGHSIPILDIKTAFISVIHIVVIFRIYEIVEIEDEIPLGKIGKVEDISKCVKWLLEDNYTTGQIISINGGWNI